MEFEIVVFGLRYYEDDCPTQVPLADHVTEVSCLCQVLRQEVVLSVQAVGMEPAHSGPLQAQTVGVVASQQGRPGRRTLGTGWKKD